MKTKEEILKSKGIFRKSIAPFNEEVLEAMEEYATQCQQDMDKKYTEEDLMSAFNAGINNDYGNGPSFDKWLNSLNKQD
jgi:hypothetical protein